MTATASGWHRHPVLWIALALVVGLWLRAPQVSAHLPYLYDHDEAPVLNRLLLMVQEGRYNPEYFRYPSLTFYLRMPAVAAGFLHAVQAGEIGSINEVITANHSVQGDVARTASHPRIVIWARSVSTVFSLLLILLTYLIARRIAPPWVAGVAALLVAITPPLIEDSEKVGVDTLMAAMCLLTVWLSLRAMEQPTVARAALAGLAAGLAVSSKYNAAPVVLVPVLAVCLSRRWSAGALAAALGLPVVGFVAGTPYAVINLPGFLDGMAYQINYYAIRGFGTYTVEPGWSHAERFLEWMFRHASGVAVTVTGFAGALLLPLSQRRAGSLILIFPVVFGLYMLNQRIAFFRNMFVLLPFFAIAATWLIERAVDRLSRQPRLPKHASAALAPTFVVLLAVQPALGAFDLWHSTRTRPESRRLVSAWLAENTAQDAETAVAADLQLPWPDYVLPGVTSSRSDQLADPVGLFLNGFDRIVAGPFTERRLSEMARPLLHVHEVFPGVAEAWETLRNPRVTIYDLPSTLAHAADVRTRVEQDERYTVMNGAVRTRLARFGLDTVDLLVVGGGRSQQLTLDLRTPWPSQSCHLELPGWRSPDLCAGLQPNQWTGRSVEIPSEALATEAPLWMTVMHVRRDPAAAPDRSNQRIGLEVALPTVSAPE